MPNIKAEPNENFEESPSKRHENKKGMSKANNSAFHVEPYGNEHLLRNLKLEEDEIEFQASTSDTNLSDKGSDDSDDSDGFDKPYESESEESELDEKSDLEDESDLEQLDDSNDAGFQRWLKEGAKFLDTDEEESHWIRKQLELFRKQDILNPLTKKSSTTLPTLARPFVRGHTLPTAKKCRKVSAKFKAMSEAYEMPLAKGMNKAWLEERAKCGELTVAKFNPRYFVGKLGKDIHGLCGHKKAENLGEGETGSKTRWKADGTYKVGEVELGGKVFTVMGSFTLWDKDELEGELAAIKELCKVNEKAANTRLEQLEGNTFYASQPPGTQSEQQTRQQPEQKPQKLSRKQKKKLEAASHQPALLNSLQQVPKTAKRKRGM